MPEVLPAQDYDSGAAAYRARDWAAAERLWQEEAANGSADAMLGLGNLLDFGLTGAPDPEGAYAYYLDAAELGVAEAAFNLGVMSDAGIGTAKDARASVKWYSFAALAGHARAQYNLGQIFAAGGEIPANARLAAFWLEQATGRIPAAGIARRLVVEDPPAPLSPPIPVAMDVIGGSEGASLRLAWIARPGPRDAAYLVELLQAEGGTLSAVAHLQLDGSAAEIPLDRGGEGLRLRLSQVSASDAEGYADSGWLTLAGEPAPEQPAGTVTFRYDATDRRARALAQRLSGPFARAGIVIRYTEKTAPLSESGVAYGYGRDAEFARQVSDFVPGIDRAEPLPDARPPFAPTEIRVTLAFAED